MKSSTERTIIFSSQVTTTNNAVDGA